MRRCAVPLIRRAAWPAVGYIFAPQREAAEPCDFRRCASPLGPDLDSAARGRPLPPCPTFSAGSTVPSASNATWPNSLCGPAERVHRPAWPRLARRHHSPAPRCPLSWTASARRFPTRIDGTRRAARAKRCEIRRRDPHLWVGRPHRQDARNPAPCVSGGIASGCSRDVLPRYPSASSVSFTLSTSGWVRTSAVNPILMPLTWLLNLPSSFTTWRGIRHASSTRISAPKTTSTSAV